VAEEADIEPTFEETGGGAQAVAALTRGDIDMAKLAFDDAMNAIGQGADIRMILSANNRQDLILAGSPEVATLPDLRGARILLTRPGPSVSSATLPPLLEQAGVEEGEYEIGYLLDSQDRSAALVSGRADAATLESADLILARQETDLNQLAELGPRVPPPGNIFVVREDFIEENSALLEEVVRELVAGYESLYAPGGRDAWIERAREEDLADQPEDVAARIYEAYRKLGYWPRRDPYTEQQHQRALDFNIEAGVIEKPTSFDEAWDTSFWSQAAAVG
jgi:ABC-type nitrate/sulfonate/bicarbonate transport system substrate-binding protein